MSRYSHPQLTPGQPTFEGDSSFVGMDMETPRWLLPPGHYAEGRNARSASGALGKRAGTIKPLWANLPAGYPGGILGSGIFNNPNSATKLMMIAAPAGVWKITSGGYPVQLALPAGVSLSGPIEFSQHFNKIHLHQGDRGPTLVWDGNPANGFEILTKAHPEETAITSLVPNTDWSIEFSGRSLFPVDRDRFGVGDENDASSWDATTRNYRANAGTSDTLTGLFPYAGGNLIIGKKSGLDVFKGFMGDLSGVTAEMVTETIGVIARKSWQMLGTLDGLGKASTTRRNDALFLSRRGVMRLSLVDQNSLQASPLPVAATRDATNGRVADPIAPLLRRINWAAAHLSVSGQDGVYYALAFPIDGAPRPNCIAWLNTISDKWEGYDLYDPQGQMQIDNLLAFDYLGEQRLFAVNHRTGTIHLLNEGVEDELAGGRYEIDLDVTTRSYATLGWNATVKRDFKRVVIPVRTSRPQITIEEQTEGAHDSRQLTKASITRDRRKYDSFGRKNYDVTNVNDDAQAPGRQDYSVVLADDEALHLGSNGVALDQKQESVLGGPGGFSTKCRGRSIGYRIRCTEGECEVLGVLVESDGSQREVRQAA